MVHVTGTSSILAVVALIAVAAISADAVAFNCPGINYNIRAGADWATPEEKCKSASQIANELKIMKSYTNVLRLYSLTDCNQATTLVPAAIEAGFQLELGLWVDSHSTSYNAEKDAFAKLLSTGVVHKGNVKGIHVGSEAIYRRDVDYNTAVSHLREIRKMCVDNGGAADVPLTITDVGNTYLAYPNLVKEVDYVSANLFPFWDNVVPAKAASYFLSTYQRLVDLAATFDGHKEVVIGETGWAMNGTDPRSSDATPENSAQYFHDFYLQAKEKNISYYYFSAFDESWKGTNTVEAYFGIFYENGEMKPTIANLVLEDESATSASDASLSASASDVSAAASASSDASAAFSASAASATEEKTDTVVTSETGSKDNVVVGSNSASEASLAGDKDSVVEAADEADESNLTSEPIVTSDTDRTGSSEEATDETDAETTTRDKESDTDVKVSYGDVKESSDIVSFNTSQNKDCAMI